MVVNGVGSTRPPACLPVSHLSSGRCSCALMGYHRHELSWAIMIAISHRHGLSWAIIAMGDHVLAAHLGLLGDALALRGGAAALRLGPGRLLDLPARNGRSATAEAVGGNRWDANAAGGDGGGGDGGGNGGGGDGAAATGDGGEDGGDGVGGDGVGKDRGELVAT